MEYHHESSGHGKDESGGQEITSRRMGYGRRLSRGEKAGLTTRRRLFRVALNWSTNELEGQIRRSRSMLILRPAEYRGPDSTKNSLMGLVRTFYAQLDESGLGIQ